MKVSLKVSNEQRDNYNSAIRTFMTASTAIVQDSMAIYLHAIPYQFIYTGHLTRPIPQFSQILKISLLRHLFLSRKISDYHRDGDSTLGHRY